jgi:ribonucleoside-diphosphate reductase alpha chain
MSAIERPLVLTGATYRLSAPHIAHAIYVTVNDVVLPDGRRRIRECFVNSKAVEDIAWMTSALRELSQNLARIETDKELLEKIDDWRKSFDAKNGSYKIPGTDVTCFGIQSHIGYVLEKHIKRTADEDAAEARKKILLPDGETKE